jgi:hypothetical protein
MDELSIEEITQELNTSYDVAKFIFETALEIEYAQLELTD